ncbi:NUDIX hydrolase, partial [Coprococcus eutactus]|nr:NUDIX hydrolase [Coprococcus eutactus]
MELFDICDEQGKPTGYIVERSEAHEKCICHRTAHIWISKKENGMYKVLLQKRSIDKDSFPGRYDTSS